MNYLINHFEDEDDTLKYQTAKILENDDLLKIEAILIKFEIFMFINIKGRKNRAI